MVKANTNFGWKKNNQVFEYFLTEKVSKRYNLKKIKFIGFSTKPTNLYLYESGGGFNNKKSKEISGDTFFVYLKKRYGKNVDLNIYKEEKKSKFEIKTQKLIIHLSLKEFLKLLMNLGKETDEFKNEQVLNRLFNCFGKNKHIPNFDKNSPNVKLKTIKLVDLTDKDHQSISKFIKDYFSANSDTPYIDEIQKKFLIEGKKVTLNKVIKKFERNLKNESLNESKWQKFLHEEVFSFLTNYVMSIRETDVNFGSSSEGEKKPDFVWIDTYGFLDIFEIKTPKTPILAARIDTSHKNYYFSTDVVKAVVQIEKYSYFLEKNVSKYSEYLKQKTKHPFSVLKPKSFIIIGNSNNINSDEKKRTDFRILRRSLKNIEIITFNELLDNLKSLHDKIDAK